MGGGGGGELPVSCICNDVIPTFVDNRPFTTECLHLVDAVSCGYEQRGLWIHCFTLEILYFMDAQQR